MYAVFVIAAILLSVSPMHARTLLAALPASTPGHQFASDEQDRNRNQGTTSKHLPSATRTTVSFLSSSHSPETIEIAATSTPAPAHPAAATGLLEHSPNAP